MNTLASLVVVTANILGCFNDPFEFDGDYGEEANRTREYVFEQVVSKEALAKNASGNEQRIVEAIQADQQHGPTLGELVPVELREQLARKQQELQEEGFSKTDLANFLDFLDRYSDQKVFYFFRHNPTDLLSLDKILRDKQDFALPILSSMNPLKGESVQELKANLLESVFTKETLKLAKPKEKLKDIDEDLALFTTPAGQAFFYWLYQSLNLHLVSQNEGMIPQINHVKATFAKTLGNPQERARVFKDKLLTSDAGLLFTQECDAVVPQVLVGEGLFHSVEAQNRGDGTFVFLRKDVWEADYRVVPIDSYEGYTKGRLNVILAARKESGERFILASCHGHSTRAEDGRLQIAKVVEKFHEFAIENEGLQLVIGIDANTKTEEDVELLREHLEALGLMATSVGPTTVKKRMVTVQHSKAGKFAVDEEDYIIVLKPEKGGRYQMTNQTVGFKEKRPDPAVTLPNRDNLSDHYPVGVILR